MKKVIFILADALRYDYIKKYDMKFLQKEINKKNNMYIKKILPSIGFCEIIEYISGKEAKENKFLAQIAFKEEVIEKKNITLLLLEKLENIIFKIPKIRGYYTKYFLEKTNNFLERYIPAELLRVRYRIPISFLPYLKPTESLYDYDSVEFGGKDNLFYKLRKSNHTYDIEDFVKYNKVKGTDKERLERLKNKIKSKKIKDFTLIYVGYGELLHFYDENNNRIKKEMKEFDKELEEINSLLKDNYDEYDFMILGDHGMVKVNKYINIYPILKKIEKKFKITRIKDYIYFIDSTMFRIKLKNKKLNKEIFLYLKKLLKDNIDENLEDYLSNFSSIYGEIKIILKPSYIFYPDFFNIKKVVGMHGFNNNIENQAGTFITICSSKEEQRFKEKEKLSSIRDYILERLKKEE